MARESPVKTVLLMTVSMAAGALLTLTMLMPQHISLNRDRKPGGLIKDPLAKGEVVHEVTDPIISQTSTTETTPYISTLRTYNHSHHPVKALQETQKARVLCWVMTHPEAHYTTAVHVKATWGSRCDKLIFVSSKNDTELGAIDLGAGEGRDVLWGKTKAAFTYVYSNYLSQYDWFYKADDDTYTIMENMRYMLSTYDPNFPIHFGSRYKHKNKHGFMGGGGGYVLSRKAVQKLVEEAFPNEMLCGRFNTSAEDLMIGICLENAGVFFGDSRDSSGRVRISQLSLTKLLFDEVIDWYFQTSYYTFRTGLRCCSDSAIAFHYTDPRKMYEMEYLLYHLRPHGVSTTHPVPLPLPPDHHSIPPQLLKERGITAAAGTAER